MLSVKFTGAAFRRCEHHIRSSTVIKAQAYCHLQTMFHCLLFVQLFFHFCPL